MTRIEAGKMVSLGYGRFFRSDQIAGLIPIEEGRGPGKRTFIYTVGQVEPFVASRSENAILRDMSDGTDSEMRTQEQYQLLADILDTIEAIDPMLRTIIREQGQWNLDRLEERISEIIGEQN